MNRMYQRIKGLNMFTSIYININIFMYSIYIKTLIYIIFIFRIYTILYTYLSILGCLSKNITLVNRIAFKSGDT